MMAPRIDLASFEQLKATGNLPSPKGVALEIIRLTQRDDLAMADLAHAVKADPAFVGRLLKTANSARLGGQRPITAIQDALTVLGIPAVRTLALGFSLLSQHKSGHCRNFDYDRFWSHSLLRAIAFQALMARLRTAAPEECFSIGLLSHVGEVALATMLPVQYSELIAEVGNAGREALLERERQVFVMTHAELSAAMLNDWGLPRTFVEPVLHHEQAEKAELKEGSRPYVLTLALTLAMRIADICLAPEAARRGLMPPLLLLGGRLSIEGDALTALCDKVAAEWREWGAMLGVSVATLPPFDELSKAPPPPAMMTGEGRPEDASGYHMRVLVVDDDAAIRGVLVSLLASHGHEVHEAADGRQAFEMAIALRPQIMIVDWVMPGMDGVELTRALRETRVGRGIYILILTGLEDEEHLVQAFEGGVDDFMAKPLRPRVLAARLRAGQRVVRLQEEVESDREEIRRFAAELAVTNRRLQEAALTDPLTGFPNRRYAMERLEQEWAVSSRGRRPLSCMVIDLDGFKQVNDRLGHDAGDLLLRRVAAALKAGLRTQDMVARIGGDEFLVVCPDTALPAALACAERVRHLVEAMPAAAGSGQLRSTVSIGVAVRDPAMANIDMLIKRADQGLYLAKERGRNRVCAWAPQAKREA